MTMEKMVAVIPACAGGSGLPNKNIRLIDGKPLIYYVIRNAKSCRYFSDIVVTTNSDVIISIAHKMGVRVRKRDASLCNRTVALEVVVHDALCAFPKQDFAYVVTMQSIAPTLRAETLEAAIEEYLCAGCDSMVSVVKKPFFFWHGDTQSPTPLYTRRMNRHLLPPFYQETGAFQITRAECITPENCLGADTRLYVLPDEEGVDVNTFGDLKQVESTLCNKRIAFYVNGNNTMGLGHIYRVLELADEFGSRPDIYFDIQQTDPAVFGVSPHRIIPVEGMEGLLVALHKTRYNVLINDVLSTTRSFMEQVREALGTAIIVNFEDDGAGATLADVVINALFENSALPNAATGHAYFIASKLFLMHDPIAIKPHVRHVLVTFGGADPNGYTEQLLDLATLPAFEHVQFRVVVGRAKQNAQELLAASYPKHIELIYDTQNMAELMSWADAAITSRGRTGYELALMGVPFLSLAQNAREEKHTFLREENGVVYLGRQPGKDKMLQALKHLVRSTAEERSLLQNRLLAHNLREGRQHVLQLINDQYQKRGK